MAVQLLQSLGVFFLLALAVLWRYSALPEIDWSHITMGALFFVTARALEVWAGAFIGGPTPIGGLGQLIGTWGVVFDIVGAALVIEGALRNAYDLYVE